MTDFTPGIYPDVPELDYHSGAFGPADSLSSSEAKTILKSPAHLKWQREHTSEPKAAFDFGHVAHALVLGTGLDIYVHDYENLRSKAAREDVEAHRALGEVVVSRADYESAQAAARAVKEHPLAAGLFASGVPEQSAYALSDCGVWMRGRFDWTTTVDGHPVIVDLKTTRDSDPGEWRRQAASLDYALQSEWYRSIYSKLTGESPRFIHVLVSNADPFLVSVVELDLDFQYVGAAKMIRALDTYKRCVETGEWPGYAETLHRLTPPAWYVSAEEDLEDQIEVN